MAYFITFLSVQTALVFSHTIMWISSKILKYRCLIMCAMVISENLNTISKPLKYHEHRKLSDQQEGLFKRSQNVGTTRLVVWEYSWIQFCKFPLDGTICNRAVTCVINIIPYGFPATWNVSSHCVFHHIKLHVYRLLSVSQLVTVYWEDTGLSYHVRGFHTFFCRVSVYGRISVIWC